MVTRSKTRRSVDQNTLLCSTEAGSKGQLSLPRKEFLYVEENSLLGYPLKYLLKFLFNCKKSPSCSKAAAAGDARTSREVLRNPSRGLGNALCSQQTG